MKHTPGLTSVLLAAFLFPTLIPAAFGGPLTELARSQVGQKGVICVLGGSVDEAPMLVQDVERHDWLVYLQTDDAETLAAYRQAADTAGVLGKRLFVDAGDPASIHLADNLADAILVLPSSIDRVTEPELLRVLRPRATAVIGDRQLTKPVPEGIDDWTHPYHGPDNNPQSQDQHVRGDFRTQFIAEPKFSPMPEQTVVAGGRIFKAMGHIAHKANQNEMLNTLLCINAYNGTILWQRRTAAGIHDSTATR